MLLVVVVVVVIVVVAILGVPQGRPQVAPHGHELGRGPLGPRLLLILCMFR